jgi:hypothetical protein
VHRGSKWSEHSGVSHFKPAPQRIQDQVPLIHSRRFPPRKGDPDPERTLRSRRQHWVRTDPSPVRLLAALRAACARPHVLRGLGGPGPEIREGNRGITPRG